MASDHQPLLEISVNGPRAYDANSSRNIGNEERLASNIRFLDRDGRSYQSMGRWNIKREGGDWRRIYTDDMFHTVVNAPTSRIIGGIFLLYTAVIYFFALAFMDISETRAECHVGIHTMTEAYIFSLETIMTIGYGAPTNDIFYGGCKSIAILLSLESFAGIFLDSICIGMFFARFGRANKRAYTVMFSNLAVIRKIRGNFYLMCQVCELRKHQLVEAHVRLYAMRQVSLNDGTDGLLYQSHQMRVQQPDDDTGAMMLIALPQIIVHRIDPWSPLFPPECLPNEGHFPEHCPAYPDPTQRMIDFENGNRGDKSHVGPFQMPTKAQLIKHLRKTDLEVIVVLEGIDGSTSNTMQARHSYKLSEMAFDAVFENCVSTKEGRVVIDFDRFHLVKRAPDDTETCVSGSVF